MADTRCVAPLHGTHLKAGGPIVFCGGAGPVVVRELGLDGHQGLAADVGDGVPRALRALALLPQPREKPAQRALAPGSVVARIGVGHKAAAPAVDGVVGEVHGGAGKVLGLRLAVVRRGEATEAVAVEEEAQGEAGEDEDVDAEVEFVAVDEQRLGEVPLRDLRLPHVHLGERARQEDALPLARGIRLDDEGGLGLGAAGQTELPLKVRPIPWQRPRFRCEAILLRKHLPHLAHAAREAPLPRDSQHPGEVVDLLVVPHLCQPLRRHRRVRPVNIPVRALLIGGNLPPVLPRSPPHRLVLAGADVDHDGRLLAPPPALPGSGRVPCSTRAGWVRRRSRVAPRATAVSGPRYNGPTVAPPAPCPALLVTGAQHRSVGLTDALPLRDSRRNRCWGRLGRSRAARVLAPRSGAPPGPPASRAPNSATNAFYTASWGVVACVGQDKVDF